MEFEAKGPQNREKDNSGFQKSWIRRKLTSNIKTEEEEKRKTTLSKISKNKYLGQKNKELYKIYV